MKWISVKDKLPPVQTDVLVANPFFVDIAWLEDGKWITSANKEVLFEVTHWYAIKCPKEVTA